MRQRERGRETDGVEKLQRERLESLIAATVLRTLGRPDDLRAVQVRPLWGDRYRVNVLRGDAMSAAIAHSYFLSADAGGELLEVSPAIEKCY